MNHWLVFGNVPIEPFIYCGGMINEWVVKHNRADRLCP